MRFKLEAMWLKHSDFINIVTKALTVLPIHLWDLLCKDSIPLSIVFNPWQELGTSVIGNLFQKKDALHTNLKVLQQAYVQRKDPNLLASEQDLTRRLHDLYLAEEIFWCQS